MQHRAPTQVRGRHRRTDALSCDHVVDPAQAYRDLLASTAPLTPADLLPARRRPAHSHRAPRRAIGSALLGERGRHAVVTVALAAGVGAAGVSAATAAAAPGQLDASAAGAAARTASHTQLTYATPAAAVSPTAAASDPMTTTSGTAAEGTAGPATATGRTLSAVAAKRKARPVPVAQWVHPMPGAVTTSCFGQRWGRLHAGVDLAAADGTPIRAAGAGTVVSAGPAEGYGNAVLIDHGNGYLTHYGHMSVITVTAGQAVKAGDQIGNEGSTGHSTGPHLHFEVHEGTYKNPIEPTRWLHDQGVDVAGCADVTGAAKD